MKCRRKRYTRTKTGRGEGGGRSFDRENEKQTKLITGCMP